ncbi:MAG: hypothetical protein MPK62_02180 [Alphaproteobacteria bacterium]|nr:hypothetical protein [Alphaproteobacteria bacterium]MDA8029942.1 hypothetical protein [Alphaproteobacteria bacterium]
MIGDKGYGGHGGKYRYGRGGKRRYDEDEEADAEGQMGEGGAPEEGGLSYSHFQGKNPTENIEFGLGNMGIEMGPLEKFKMKGAMPKKSREDGGGQQAPGGMKEGEMEEMEDAGMDAGGDMDGGPKPGGDMGGGPKPGGDMGGGAKPDGMGLGGGGTIPQVSDPDMAGAQKRLQDMLKAKGGSNDIKIGADLAKKLGIKAGAGGKPLRFTDDGGQADNSKSGGGDGSPDGKESPDEKSDSSGPGKTGPDGSAGKDGAPGAPGAPGASGMQRPDDDPDSLKGLNRKFKKDRFGNTANGVKSWHDKDKKKPAVVFAYLPDGRWSETSYDKNGIVQDVVIVGMPMTDPTGEIPLQSIKATHPNGRVKSATFDLGDGGMVTVKYDAEGLVEEVKPGKTAKRKVKDLGKVTKTAFAAGLAREGSGSITGDIFASISEGLSDTGGALDLGPKPRVSKMDFNKKRWGGYDASNEVSGGLPKGFNMKGDRKPFSYILPGDENPIEDDTMVERPSGFSLENVSRSLGFQQSRSESDIGNVLRGMTGAAPNPGKGRYGYAGFSGTKPKGRRGGGGGGLPDGMDGMEMPEAGSPDMEMMTGQKRGGGAKSKKGGGMFTLDGISKSLKETNKTTGMELSSILGGGKKAKAKNDEGKAPAPSGVPAAGKARGRTAGGKEKPFVSTIDRINKNLKKSKKETRGELSDFMVGLGASPEKKRRASLF